MSGTLSFDTGGTLAFDVYGTLVDPMGMTAALAALVGDDAAAFATQWRTKQFEYLFRRGLGRKYQPFSVCTKQALDHTCLATGHALNEAGRSTLLAGYLTLPAYDDAISALAELKSAGFDCYAFSNGEPDDLETLLSNAGLLEYLQGIVSADEVRTFKPDPALYGFFLENTGALLGRTWLVSANPFDVIGAMEVGWKAAWVQRNEDQLFDPWGIKPTAIVASLSDLTELV